MRIFTGRNEVLAKVIFSQACVILSTGGGYLTRHTYPPRTRQVHPPGPDIPPWTRQVHPPDQAGTPPRPGRYTPPDQTSPRPGRYTPQTRQVHPPDQAGTLPLGPDTPPDQAGTLPPGPDTPPDQAGTPRPDTPQDQAGTPPPRTRQVHPPGTRHPAPQPGRYTPWEQQTPEYSQHSAGMHPTGMHSC